MQAIEKQEQEIVYLVHGYAIVVQSMNVQNVEEIVQNCQIVHVPMGKSKKENKNVLYVQINAKAAMGNQITVQNVDHLDLILIYVNVVMVNLIVHKQAIVNYVMFPVKHVMNQDALLVVVIESLILKQESVIVRRVQKVSLILPIVRIAKFKFCLLT